MSEILDVFEMTPMQAGMLFQSLYDPGGGSYVQQYWGRLDGALDGDAFRAAWAAVIARHEMLRAQCHWQGLDHPAFAINAEAEPAWQVLDWSQSAGCLEDWLAEDRARGFAMDAVPLMRFALIRLGADEHVFVWTFHHMLLDGWCGALVVRDMLNIYAGQGPAEIPAPFRTYLDWREGRDMTANEAFWRDALRGLEGPTPLGIDRADTGQSGVQERRFRLSAEESGALTSMARANRLTLATLMQGVWGLILSRYAGQSRVTFGTVLSGRPADLPGAETMIGLFLNTVPVTVEAPGGMCARDWLADIQTSHRAREEHGHVALSDLQGWAGFDGATPLFDSLLIVETYPESIEAAIERDGVALRLSETGFHEQTNFPLVIKVLPGRELEFCLSADTGRIPPEAITRLEGHLRQVLGRFAAMPQLCPDTMEILGDGERADLLEMAQGPEPQVTRSVLADLLAREPDGMAVETPDGQRWRHGALMARAARIATGLRGWGIGKGDVVAICQDRTPDLLASLIAVWRVGAAYLPLDPIYPAERIAYILEDAGAVLALVDDTGRAALGADGTLPVMDVADCTARADLPDEVGLGDLAYILYTSGSTGRPKGVPITHGALANFIASMRREPGLGATDRLLAVTTVAFDIAALELFGPLVAGGVVVIAPSGAGVDGKGLAQMIEAHAITVKQATPAGWRVLRDSGWSGRAGLKMLSGGEALDSALAADLIALGGELWNLYGPTETTIWSGALRVAPEHLSGAKVPVGGPLDNTTLSVRDGVGRLVPLDVPGELWIGGLGLSPGYLNRPDLTADRFVLHEGARYYRTGDQVRQNRNGTLSFLGRLDDQVKLRGYRIELGEIEKQLEAQNAITQAVVLVRGEGNEARLVGYLRGDDTSPPEAARLRAALSEVLPAYMIPTVFVPVDRFPLTPNGKINRKALPDPGTAAGTARGASAGLSERDAVVASIWAQAIGVTDVSADDDFFALGGHSLSALRVISEVRQVLGVELSLRDLFDAPVFCAFCARLAGAQGRAPLPAVVPSPTPSMSSAQIRLWLLSRLNPEGAQYHLSLSLRLAGALDPEALSGALGTLARRHSVLRSRFPALDGLASVEILPDFTPRLRRDDLSDAPEASIAGTLHQIRHEEATGPFDMTNAPPWRVRLVTCAPGDHVLILTMHHILADEWSFGVLLDELAEGYRGAVSRAPLAAQYGDFARWQGALDLSEQRAYWSRQLARAPSVTALPADRDRPARRSGAAGRITIRLGQAETDALEAIARENGATLFMCLLSAYAVFLNRHTGETDLIIGTPVSNRRMSEFHALVGLFVNTLAMRTDLRGVTCFGDLLTRTRDTVLAGHAHQDLPFEQLFDLLSAPRSESHGAIVQTFFSMSDVVRAGELTAGLTWEALPSLAHHARFDLSLDLSRGPEGLSGHFEYALDMFTEDRVVQLVRRFERLLAGIAAAPEAVLSELPLLSEAERALVLPVVTYPAEEGTLQDVAAPRAAGTPVFDARLADHLAGVAQGFGTVSTVSTGCAPGSDAAALAEAIAARAGGTCRYDGPEAAIVLNGERVIRIGSFADPDADLVFLPELPAAFVREGGLLRPLPGVRALIVDDEGALIPPGLPGWLAVGGAGLARGYAGDPARTAELFLPNPHADPLELDPAETCLLRTPYRARLEQSGGFVACAPPDPVPLLGGLSLEPATIEAAFAAHPGIASAILAMPRGGRVPERLELVLYPVPGAVPVTDAQLVEMAAALPLGARPSLFHWRDRPVLSDAQAPDRATLWEALRAGNDAGGAPQGLIEETLADLWREVLEVTALGRNDGFFELGGDSIRAVQIAARAEEAGIHFDPGEIFHHQTIAALAAHAQLVIEDTAVPDLPDLELDLETLSELVSFGDD